MTNFEKHFSFLNAMRQDPNCHGIAIVDNQPVYCIGQCYDCDLHWDKIRHCSSVLLDWLFDWNDGDEES